MKITSLGISLLAGAYFLTSCSTQKNTAETKTVEVKKEENHAHAQQHDHGIALDLMDTSVRPQDDFYNYVNGGWMKTAVIPSDKSTWGSFQELREKTDENSLKILKKHPF